MRRAARWTWVAGGGAAVLALAVGVVLSGFGLDGADDRRPAPQVDTVAVTRGDLTLTVTATGRLVHTGERTVEGRGGIITWLPPVGQPIDRGGTVYRADDQPVVLLLGEFPFWRTLVPGDTGQDVAQLEHNLSALGLLSVAPDDRFGTATSAAMREWQKRLGWERTGIFDPASVVLAPSALVVREILGSSGGTAAGPVLSASGPGKEVRVDVPLDERDSAVIGSSVQVVLPDGSSTPATVTSIGGPTERETATGTAMVVPVVVVLDDPAAGGDFAQSNVRVEFARTLKEDALQVPVVSLLALTENGFGVEVLDDEGTRVVPVELGAFGSHTVEVSGGELSEGDRVVVPS